MATAADARATIARTYAEAILALAAASGAAHEIAGELDGFVAFLDGQPEVDGFLASPVEDAEAKRALLEKAFRGRASDLFVDALQVMCVKRRLGLVREVAAAYAGALAESEHRVRVLVRSAVPLADALRRELEAAVSRATGWTAELALRVDPGILGGLVVRIGDEKIDASVRARLEEARAALLARGVREMLSGRTAVVEG